MYNEVSNSLSRLHDSDFSQVISLHIAEKRMPVMNFKIGNAKN